MHKQMIFLVGTKTIIEEGYSFQQMVLEQFDIHMQIDKI